MIEGSMLRKIYFWAFVVGGLCWFCTKSLVFAAEIKVLDENCYDQIAQSTHMSKTDITLYKKILRAIAAEDIEKADDLIEDVENDFLMGHVRAQKYLSKSYTTTYAELKDWLENYADHPQAKSIYNLAVRKGRDEGLINPFNDFDIGQKFFSPYSWYNEDYELSRPQYAKYLRSKVKDFRKYINAGKTRRAKMILEDKTFRMRIPNKNYDAMSATLALAYLMDNQDKLALAWVEKASRRSNEMTANWVGGLAAWRMNKLDTAAKYFVKLGKTKDNDEWLTAAGAYWAYRVYQKQNKPKKAQEMLELAGKYSRTFYGIVANYKLGKPISYNWENVAYYNDFSKKDYVNEMLSSESLKRAVLLIKAKHLELAAKEIDASYKNMSDAQKEVALFITKENEMRALGIKLALCLRNNDQAVYYDDAAYPMPDWSPKGGWKIDKALVWAFVHQESRFYPLAMSGAGAKGLMQIMPRTAQYILQTKKKVGDEVLLDTERNLAMGQEYINYLLEKPFIDGNLFYLATAYNAGPGNLLKWEKRMKYNKDPLLFIEVLPARETRLYIKRVMANYWIYNARMGQDNYTLKEVAEGKYPILKRDKAGFFQNLFGE